MRLSSFIRSSIDEILVEWDRFARRNAPEDHGMSDLALRDHAKEMLLNIAADIEKAQSARQQVLKSQGLGSQMDHCSAAFVHGTLRQRHDFTLLQLSAEFRALRATVLKLWLAQVETMCETTVDELVRFDESIDQALAESITAYSDAATQSRELFLAVLGHDLRSPLATMALSGDLLARRELDPGQLPKLAERVQRSAKLMKSMVDDLLGYTRTQLGKGMPITRSWCDIADVLDDAITDATSTHPDARFELRTTGDLAACYDSTRLHQLFINLLVNAAQYGLKTQPVQVEATAADDCNRVRITNQGAAISTAAMKSIFQPLVQLSGHDATATRPKTSLGLGLFIAREIAESHGGKVTVHSEEGHGTTFTVELPRDFSCRPSR